MDSLLNEINNIDSLYKSQFWKQIDAVDSLGKQAMNTGDPSFILTFCHEIYTFLLVCEANFHENEEISNAVRLYNSGMSLEFAEYYMSWTYKILQKLKKYISNCT